MIPESPIERMSSTVDINVERIISEMVSVPITITHRVGSALLNRISEIALQSY